jgi:threonine dehydratase
LKELIPEIEAAASVVNRFVDPTPILESNNLNKNIGGRIFLKAENYQPTGSFKLRGALNAISKLDEDQLTRGVVAYSSGNHAIGVAFAAECLGTKATLIIPKDIPQKKLERIKSFNAEIIFYDRELDNREEIGQKICQERDLSLIKPYDDMHTICGQGTCGLEAVRQINTTIDAAIICAGGGGLAAGIGSYLKHALTDINIFTAEPEGWDDHKISFERKTRVSCNNNKSGICDGVLTPIPGELTFAINMQNEVSGLSVSEDLVLKAMQIAFKEFNIKLEPSGAVALACLLDNKEIFEGQNVLVTLSGGNVDEEKFLSCFDS